MTSSASSTRIAVCGGPYANPYALEAFVADARRRGCERLYCLGDLGGFGADINAIWPVLLTNRIVCVAGNYDVAIARGDPDCGCGYRDPRDNHYAQLIYDHTRANVSRDFAAWMAQLPTERRELHAGCDIHFVHGSPLALNDFWWESLPPAEHDARISASGADVICCTHSGLPWQRRIGSTLIVNAGAIGKPANDGHQEVWYTVIDVADGQASATLIPLSYDWLAQARSMRAARLPEAFVETIETGWWTTCIEVLPPAERSRGRYQLYDSSLPTGFTALGGSWGDSASPSNRGERPVVPLFGSVYFPPRLWIYTNFNCNLQCDYCAVGSSPRAKPRRMSADRFRDIVDEAVTEGFTELYITGGEPLMHPQITELVEYATSRLPTVLLTNAVLFRGTRQRRFDNLANGTNLIIQTSLDGAQAQTHDAHRGQGSWARTIEGIQTVRRAGLNVRVAMTETPENVGETEDMASILDGLGVPPEGFVVRPLLRRGFSAGGVDIAPESTVPELTMTADGAYWHPAGADVTSSTDMLLASGNVPLRAAKEMITELFFAARLADGTMPQPYRCAV